MMWGGGGIVHRSLLIHQHPGVTLLQGEKAVSLKFALGFSLRAQSHSIVERLIGEEIPSQMVDRFVIAILRHIDNRETILARRRRHVLGGRIFRRALKAISTRASPLSKEGWSPPLV